MTFYGTTLEDQVYIKSFNYQNSTETNSRKYSTNTLSWSNLFRSCNYTIDFIKTTAQYDSFSTDGFQVLVKGGGRGGVSTKEQRVKIMWNDLMDSHTLLTKGTYNSYSYTLHTFVITIKDLSLFSVDSCYK